VDAKKASMRCPKWSVLRIARHTVRIPGEQSWQMYATPTSRSSLAEFRDRRSAANSHESSAQRLQ
jgi:hypothetical protein